MVEVKKLLTCIWESLVQISYGTSEKLRGFSQRLHRGAGIYTVVCVHTMMA